MSVSDPESTHERFRRKFRPSKPKRIRRANMRGRVAPVRRGLRNDPTRNNVDVGQGLRNVCEFIITNADHPEIFDNLKNKAPIMQIVEHMMAVRLGGWKVDEDNDGFTNPSGRFANSDNWLLEDDRLVSKSLGEFENRDVEWLEQIRQQLYERE